MTKFGTMTLALMALAAWSGPAPAADAPKEEFTFSGPYTHQNLTVFLVHGKDNRAGRKLLTLPEALEQKKIVVHETKNVNELAVENVSADTDVFIQSGDVVKGGQQDRVLSYDLIVSAKSGKVPIQSFCVEQGRWNVRGKEDATKFDSSVNNANGKALKQAVNQARNQGEVWQKVREAQMKLQKQVGQSVQNEASPSSLQLTLENKKLLESLDGYTKALLKATEGKTDVVGYVVAVNGKVEGADIYGSPWLFEKSWARLLKGCAVDALGEFDKEKKFTAATLDDVKTFLADAAAGKAQASKDVSARVNVQTKEAAKSCLIESCDKENGGQFIRRNYFAKQPPSANPPAVAPQQRQQQQQER